MQEHVVIVAVASTLSAAFVRADTFWQERACTELALSETAGIAWCADAVVVSDDRFELQLSWRGYGLSGNSIQKDADTGNRNMYLKDGKGRRYDHVATEGACQLGGQIDNEHPILRGAFIFKGIPPSERTFSFYDDDQHLAITGIQLSEASRTDRETSLTLLGHLAQSRTIQIDYGPAEGAREQYRLTRENGMFRFEGTSSGVVPASTVASFLYALTESPLLERHYVRRHGETDHAGVTIDLSTPSGDISFGSQSLSARTWVAQTEASSYMIPDDTPTRALRELDAALGRDPASRVLKLLTPYLGAEKASEVWTRIETRVGAEEGSSVALRWRPRRRARSRRSNDW
jgi:hypothetical protein